MKKSFTKATRLDELIAQYFNQADQHTHEQTNTKKASPAAAKKDKVQPWAPTLSGLAFHLGFNSRQEFEEYESKGKFADRLKRARLQIETFCEKKLHTQYTSGAIFALKNLGWADRVETKPIESDHIAHKIEVIITGPQLASSENEVVL